MSTAIVTTRRREYSDDDRATGIALLQANSGNLSRTAKQLGVPRKTLAGWATVAQDENQPAPVELLALRQQKKALLAGSFRDLAAEIAGVLRTKLGSMSGRDLAIALGILTDKWQLLEGGPTQRTESYTPDPQLMKELYRRYGGTKETRAQSSLTPDDVQAAAELVAANGNEGMDAERLRLFRANFAAAQQPPPAPPAPSPDPTPEPSPGLPLERAELLPHGQPARTPRVQRVGGPGTAPPRKQQGPRQIGELARRAPW